MVHLWIPSHLVLVVEVELQYQRNQVEGAD